MQQRKIVEDYLNSVIPEKISEATKTRLRAELECHISDRADFYMEIGYVEDSAFTKAIEQMGEGEEVKTEFESLYNDSTLKAVLLLFLILFFDLLAAISNFGGAQFLLFFDEHISMFSSFESLVISVSVVCFNILLIIYSYRNHRTKKLKALGYANLIMSAIPFIFNSLYYPFSYLVFEAIADLTNTSDFFHFSDFRFYMAEFVSLPMCICCFGLLFRLKKCVKYKRRKNISFFKISFVVISFFLSVSACGLYFCNNPVSEYFNHSGLAYLVEEYLVEPLKSDSTEKLFDSITGDTDFSQADEMLKKDGFIPHTDIEKYLSDKEDLDRYEFELQYILNGTEEIVYTRPDEGYISYLNGCIILYPAETGKIKYKKIIDADDYYTKKDDTAKAKELFEAFRFADDKKTVLSKMKKVTNIVSFSVEYDENIIKEVYCFKAFKDLGFLSLVDQTSFDATLIFENGILKGGNYTYTVESNYDTDDVVCTKDEYAIGG